MYRTAEEAKADRARSEADWQSLTAAQRRGVAVGVAMMGAALVAGSMQPRFNGIAIFAMFACFLGLLIVLRALSAR